MVGWHGGSHTMGVEPKQLLAHTSEAKDGGLEGAGAQLTSSLSPFHSTLDSNPGDGLSTFKADAGLSVNLWKVPISQMYQGYASGIS